ncbi:hypothetical protein FA13DRAFT_1782667 [Coprinellus micaceus]|uniref:Uncharacterized protein n=1 Tax=Coprinellus micaceus TaxID=71717 RepID=A0A4Y7RYK1_COPMI|nr:hypothetical protein FA13DRAFT_1782667 [Coprinellus micaceus]
MTTPPYVETLETNLALGGCRYGSETLQTIVCERRASGSKAASRTSRPEGGSRGGYVMMQMVVLMKCGVECRAWTRWWEGSLEARKADCAPSAPERDWAARSLTTLTSPVQENTFSATRENLADIVRPSRERASKFVAVAVYRNLNPGPSGVGIREYQPQQAKRNGRRRERKPREKNRAGRGLNGRGQIQHWLGMADPGAASISGVSRHKQRSR